MNADLEGIVTGVSLGLCAAFGEVTGSGDASNQAMSNLETRMIEALANANAPHAVTGIYLRSSAFICGSRYA
jgi:hypothetical protein